MTHDLYQVLGGTPGDIIHAVERLLDSVDHLHGDPEGIRILLLICRHLLRQAQTDK
jgi:hypothetical protein